MESKLCHKSNMNLRHTLSQQSNPKLLEIPESIRRIVAPVVRGIRTGNNETFYMIGMRVLITAQDAATLSGPDNQPNIGQTEWSNAESPS